MKSMSLRIGTWNAVEEHVELLEEDALDDVDDERADGHAPDVAHAAQHDHREHGERDREPELVGAHEVSLRGAEDAGEAGVDAPSANASSLVVTVLMPLLGRRQLVLADRLPGAAEAGVLEAVDEDHRPR